MRSDGGMRGEQESGGSRQSQQRALSRHRSTTLQDARAESETKKMHNEMKNFADKQRSAKRAARERKKEDDILC